MRKESSLTFCLFGLFGLFGFAAGVLMVTGLHRVQTMMLYCNEMMEVCAF
jgi:hypothetical protein